MAAQRRQPEDEGRGANPSDLVAEAAAAPRTVYLLQGEPLQTGPLARTLIDRLLPAGSRDFSLEMVDGSALSPVGMLERLRTRGFLGGRKVVWVRETSLFLPGEKRPDVTKTMLEAAAAGKEEEGCRRLLALAVLAEWSPEEFASTSIGSLSKTRRKEFFGVDLGEADLAAAERLQQSCRERELVPSGGSAEATALLDWLSTASADDVVLILTASSVDLRKPLVRRLGDLGRIVDLRPARERSGGLSRETIDRCLDEIAAAHGKHLESAAREVFARRAGRDLAVVGSEMEKLCLGVGERKTIGPEDVRRFTIDHAESWIFDLTGALARRDLAAAIPLLRGLLAAGEPPLRLLTMLVREVRLLLLTRELMESSLAGVFRPGLAYPAFQKSVLPRIDEESLVALGRPHPFVLFRKFEEAGGLSVARLRRALRRLSELDVRLKSARSEPGLLLESFLLEWCRGADGRTSREPSGQPSWN